MQEIGLDLPDAGNVCEIGAALEMVVEAAVVEIDAADDRLVIVADKAFRVQEARRIFPDAHAGVHQRLVVPLAEIPDHFLVRDAGHQKTHVHAAFGGEFQRRLQFAVQNEIGRHDIDIVLGRMEDVLIDHFTGVVTVERRIGIRDHEAGRVRLRVCVTGGVEVGRKILRLLFVEPPHFEEHGREAAHGASGEHDGAVLPVAEAGGAVDILIGKVHAAVEGHPAIDDHDLAVITIVVGGGDKGLEPQPDLATDTELLQSLGIKARDGAHLAGSVIHHADLHALGRLAGQDLQDSAPHGALADDEVFQKDKLLGTLELAQHFLERLLAEREIAHGRRVMDRIVYGPVDIACKRG